MRLAFSSVSCPTWDFDTIVARAKEYGYEGVEIRGFREETTLTAADVFDRTVAVADIFARGGIQIACLASSVSMTGKRDRDAAAADEVKLYVDRAKELNCPLVKVFDSQVRPGQSRAGAGITLGNWLVPLGDYAAERGVTIVIENSLSFRSAKEMWLILDRLQHPSIAVCWDVFNAALIGESPATSVPFLNSRIQHVHVKDAKIGPLGASHCRLGEGDVPVRDFVHRLRGIGYGGWVTVEWDKAFLSNLAPPEEILPDAIAKLKTWMSEGVDEPKPAKAAPAKHAAPAKA